MFQVREEAAKTTKRAEDELEIQTKNFGRKLAQLEERMEVVAVQKEVIEKERTNYLEKNEGLVADLKTSQRERKSLTNKLNELEKRLKTILPARLNSFWRQETRLEKCRTFWKMRVFVLETEKASLAKTLVEKDALLAEREGESKKWRKELDEMGFFEEAEVETAGEGVVDEDEDEEAGLLDPATFGVDAEMQENAMQTRESRVGKLSCRRGRVGLENCLADEGESGRKIVLQTRESRVGKLQTYGKTTKSQVHFSHKNM